MTDWIVFRSKEGKELMAYTAAETFHGELKATLELLSSERGIPICDISVSVEKRKASRRKG